MHTVSLLESEARGPASPDLPTGRPTYQPRRVRFSCAGAFHYLDPADTAVAP